MIALCCGPAAAHELPTTTPAARFLQDRLDRALVLARPPVSAKANGELDILIRDAMDWPSLAQFAIGHYGASLDEGGRSDATARLERQLGLLARRAGRELPTMTIAIHDMRIDPNGNRHIISTATVPRFGEVEVEWTLTPTATGYRVAISGPSASPCGSSCAVGLPRWLPPRAAMPPPFSTMARTHRRDDKPRKLC